MRRPWLIPTVFMALWGSCFCSNKLSGTVEVNGEKVGFNSCRNGIIHGFRGVELSASNGMRLRLGVTPTGKMGVIVFPKDAAVGTELGIECGSLSLSDQNSTVNDVKNVQGKAVLDCEAQGYKLKGEVSFENCH
ncbi:MAG: hypothetical protein F9K40_11325 [Kofleriaceae bacterium]|nr:MAG: hypothetical protein F9K40_11325 [Kofleriaceae bacterium]MBZ0234291.1 hypothetical protein [Kofleriaceae bacterium]